MAAPPFWANFRKKLFGGNVGVRSYPDAILRGAARNQLSVPQLGYNPTPSQVWGKASRMAGPTRDVSVPGMFKNPLGKMSPEELKDFQSVLREMQIDTKPEFVRPGTINQPQMGSFKHQPFLFDEATAAEYQRRKKFNPYV